MKLLWSLLLLYCSAAVAAPSQWVVGQTVKTNSGTVKGFSSSFETDVSEYRGIRFGEDTSGKNRFMRPKPYRNESAVIDGSDFGTGCPQASMLPFGIHYGLSEDCLFLNVFTKPQVGERKKAVMVWIYGGGFSMGDAGSSVYIGSKLAASQDVVVVSINYRTNVFGFPGSPALPDQNLGMWDQRLAVEWVRDNIAAFGGDPERITIFGESAGAMSVDYYSYAWLQDPIVKGLISQSGTAMMSDKDYDQRKLRKLRVDSWYDLTANLKCPGSDKPEEALACVQSKRWQDVVDYTPEYKGHANQFDAGFGPVPDDKILGSDYFASAKAGKIIMKPMLVGSNHNESALFKISARLSGDIFETKAAEQLDLKFTCGAAEAAKARLLHNVPVWRYHFSNTKDGSTDGAVHFGEVPYVFGVGGRYLGPLFSFLGAANNPDLVPVIQDAWGAFARDPVNGLTQHGWPRYDPTGNTLIRLGHNGQAKAEFVNATLYDTGCAPSQLL